MAPDLPPQASDPRESKAEGAGSFTLSSRGHPLTFPQRLPGCTVSPTQCRRGPQKDTNARTRHLRGCPHVVQSHSSARPAAPQAQTMSLHGLCVLHVFFVPDEERRTLTIKYVSPFPSSKAQTHPSLPHHHKAPLSQKTAPHCVTLPRWTHGGGVRGREPAPWGCCHQSWTEGEGTPLAWPLPLAPAPTPPCPAVPAPVESSSPWQRGSRSGGDQGPTRVSCPRLKHSAMC